MVKKKEEPKFLSITNKTLRYGNQTYQISNLTHVAKYEIEKKPKIKTSVLIWAIVICIGSFLLSANSVGEFIIVSLITGTVAVVGVRERIAPPTYAFSLETSSGSSKLFSSTNEQFIDNLIARISRIMDDDTVPVSYSVNIADNSITDNSETVMGDKFQGIKDSNITNIKNSTVREAFNSKVTLDPATVDALNSVSQAITETPNSAAAKALFENFQKELAQQEPDKSRLKQYWDGVVAVCPQISSVAGVLEKITRLFS